MTRARDHLVLAGSRSGTRAAGAWLQWSIAPLDLSAPPLADGTVVAREMDPAIGAMARTIPGPDPTGVRVVQLGADLDDTGQGGGSIAALAGNEPLRGPLGPDAGARTLLDAAVRDRIRNAQPPSFDTERGGLPPEAIVDAREALERVRRPVGEIDLGASVYVVTEVLAWESCPRQYLYEHVLGARGESLRSRSTPPELHGLSETLFGSDDETRLGFDEREGDGLEGATASPLVDDPERLPRHILGTATHRALEIPPSERTRARVKEVVAEEVSELVTPAGLGRTVDLVLEWIATFERSPLGQRAARTRPGRVRREEPFLVRVPLAGVDDAILLRGTADLVILEDSGGVLVDYKTNDLTPLEVPLKVPAYALQLQLYALALSIHLGAAPREAWLAFLAADQSVSVDVSPLALEVARARLARFAEGRRRGEFAPRVSSLCRTCAFREICPAVEKGVV